MAKQDSAEDLRQRLQEIERKELQEARDEYNEFIQAWSAKHKTFVDNEYGLKNSDGQPLRFVIRKVQ
jgi:hypothetical protein